MKTKQNKKQTSEALENCGIIGVLLSIQLN